MNRRLEHLFWTEAACSQLLSVRHPRLASGTGVAGPVAGTGVSDWRLEVVILLSTFLTAVFPSDWSKTTVDPEGGVILADSGGGVLGDPGAMESP